MKAYVLLLGLIALVPDRVFQNGLTLVFPASRGKHSQLPDQCEFREHVPGLLVLASKCKEGGLKQESDCQPDSPPTFWRLGSNGKGVWYFDLKQKHLDFPDSGQFMSLAGGSSHWKAAPTTKSGAADGMWIADFAAAGFTLSGVERNWEGNPKAKKQEEKTGNGKAVALAVLPGGSLRTCALAEMNRAVVKAKFVTSLDEPKASYHFARAVSEAVEIQQKLPQATNYELVLRGLDGSEERHLRFGAAGETVIALLVHEPDWNTGGCGDMNEATGRDFELYYGLLSKDSGPHYVPELLEGSEGAGTAPLFCLADLLPPAVASDRSIGRSTSFGIEDIEPLLSHPAFCPPAWMQ